MKNRIIDQQLNNLREKFFSLGDKTVQAVENAIRSLSSRDGALAKQVIEDDKLIDRIELEIDRLSIEILALQQPAAHDLRMVIAISKVTPILERIADHATNIAQSVLNINEEPQLQEFEELPAMAKNVDEMLHAALVAFTGENAESARRIIAQDKEIDVNYKRFLGELIGMMISNPATTACAAELLFVAKHLERIGDYVKDICELTVYLTEAVFIKHGHFQPDNRSPDSE